MQQRLIYSPRPCESIESIAVLAGIRRRAAGAPRIRSPLRKYHLGVGSRRLLGVSGRRGAPALEEDDRGRLLWRVFVESWRAIPRQTRLTFACHRSRITAIQPVKTDDCVSILRTTLSGKDHP